jgi:hypothetical protein
MYLRGDQKGLYPRLGNYLEVQMTKLIFVSEVIGPLLRVMPAGIDYLAASGVLGWEAPMVEVQPSPVRHYVPPCTLVVSARDARAFETRPRMLTTGSGKKVYAVGVLLLMGLIEQAYFYDDPESYGNAGGQGEWERFGYEAARDQFLKAAYGRDFYGLFSTGQWPATPA